ncbi:MAG: C4-dicarboxylate ABC transporter substrate-binding protein, partial [Castellaniella sp.]|nr:C4-dicarboxylate ABC transporter substrate-binding protein [Castellaniella sp.]
AYQALPDAYKAALAVAAREVSSSLRQHILVADGKAIDAFKAQGVEVSSLDPADVAQARKKVVEVWRKATKDDALATQILDSQIAFMEKLGLIA